MTKYKVIILVLVFFTSCEKAHDIEYLNGYWEIEEVILENGVKKKYGVNTTIDYIQLNSDSIGIRKKLYPLLDGTFRTTNNIENLTIVEEDNKVIIKYSTGMYKWSEELIELNENRLVLKNDSAIRYIYKRFQKFDLNDKRENQ